MLNLRWRNLDVHVFFVENDKVPRGHSKAFQMRPDQDMKSLYM